MVVVPAAIEVVALAVAAVPFLQHRWDMHRWERDHLDGHAPKTDGHAEPLTVLLPVWNEATVIKEKTKLKDALNAVVKTENEP